MGRLAEVLECYVEEIDGMKISRVKCDAGGGRPITADHYSGVGEEENPLPGDFAFLAEDSGTGRWVALRFFDPKWVRRGAPGEHVRYSRSSDGTPKTVIHLKADGSCVVNEKVTISASGAVDAAGEVTAKAGTPGAVGGSTHTHTTPVAPTSPPTPGT